MALGTEPDSPALLLRSGTVIDGSGAPRYNGITDILITWSTPHPEMAARSLAGIAAEWGCTQQEACERLQPGGACYFQMREDDVQRVLRHPATMIGSDACRTTSIRIRACGERLRACSATTAATSACFRSRPRCTR